MHQEPLTDLTVKALKPRSDVRYEVFDVKVPGFGVRVFPSGIKSFVLLYRQHGRLRRLTLGRYPVLSLAEARRLAQTALNRVAHGTDPQQIKAERRNGYRFDEAAEAFVRMHCSRHNRASTTAMAAGTLDRHFVEKWGSRDIREIKRGDILSVLDNLIAGGMPSAAIRSLAVIRKFFNWSVERGLIETNPCVGIRAPAQPRSRDRVLGMEEIATIWRGVSTVTFPFGAIVQLLILTAQRRNEVAGMRWSQLDLDKSVWTLPPETTKNGRGHMVPLSKLAVSIIRSLPRLDDHLVFPSIRGGGRTFSGFGKSKARLDSAAGVDGWTLHDLRRSAATMMAEMGTSPHVIERILNHVSGTVSGVAAVYNRFSYLPEMRVALEKWSDAVVAVGRQHGAVSQDVATVPGEA